MIAKATKESVAEAIRQITDEGKKATPTAIHRLENKGDGEWEQTWAWGDWNDAASLDYIPINETRDI